MQLYIDKSLSQVNEFVCVCVTCFGFFCGVFSPTTWAKVGPLQSTVISVLFLFHGLESELEGERPLGPENMFVCPVFCVITVSVFVFNRYILLCSSVMMFAQ